jgi:hypothetical protein
MFTQHNLTASYLITAANFSLAIFQKKNFLSFAKVEQTQPQAREVCAQKW